MYRIDTNFGVYNVELMPSLEDTLKYWAKAHSVGIAVDKIRFKITELPRPEAVYITHILNDVRD